MPLNLETVYNTQLSLANESAKTENKQKGQQNPCTEQSSSYQKRAPRVPYRWRKLKMTYSTVVLAMYPYLAEPDSDGDDDIAEEEEDDHMRWDPVQKTHVKRETPLTTPIKQDIGTEPVNTIDAKMNESPVEDGVGVEILLEAAKALFGNRQDNQDIVGGGHASDTSLARPDRGKAVTVAGSISSSSAVLKLSQDALKQYPSPFPKAYPHQEFNYTLPDLYHCLPTLGREYDLSVVKEQDGLKSKNDLRRVGAPQDSQPCYKAIAAPKEAGSEGLGIEYNSLGFTKIPDAGETSKVAKRNFRANSEIGYQSGWGSKAPGSVINYGEQIGVCWAEHPYPTTKAKAQNVSSHTPRFSECNPVHRFHNFKHQTNFRRAIITYRRIYDKPMTQVLYKPKLFYKQRSVCGRDSDDQQSISCKETIQNNSGTGYDSSNCETYGGDQYTCDDRKISQSREFTAMSMEEMIALGYMSPQPNGLCEISKSGVNYAGHANLAGGNGIPLRMHNMVECGHRSVSPKPKNLKEFRDSGYFGPKMEPIILDTDSYIPQSQGRDTSGSSKEYDLWMFSKMLSGGSGSPGKQETLLPMMDESSIPAQGDDSEVIGKINRDSNKPLDEQENLGFLVGGSTFVHGIARDLVYKKGEVGGRQHMMKTAGRFADDIVKQQNMRADTIEPSLAGTSSTVVERDLYRAVLELTPEDIGQQGDVTDRIDSTRKQRHPYRKSRERSRPWRDHAYLLDPELGESGQHGEASDRSRRDHYVHPETTRRRHEGPGGAKGSSRKRRRHRSISKEAEFRDSSHRRRCRHHESRSPRKSHKSSHWGKSGYESDKSRLETKDCAPDRGRRRNRDLEYDRDYPMAEGSSRKPVTRKHSYRSSSPSPVHLVKTVCQKEKTPEDNRSTLQGVYSHRKASEKSSKSRHKTKGCSPHGRHHSSYASDSSWDPNARHNSPSVQAKTTRQQETIPAKVHQALQNRWSHLGRNIQEQQGLAQNTHGPRGNDISSFRGNLNRGYRSNNNQSSYRGHSGHNKGSRRPTRTNDKVRGSLVSNENGSQSSRETEPEPHSQPLKYPRNNHGYPGLTRRNNMEVDIDIEEEGSWGKHRH